MNISNKVSSFALLLLLSCQTFAMDKPIFKSAEHAQTTASVLQAASTDAKAAVGEQQPEKIPVACNTDHPWCAPFKLKTEFKGLKVPFCQLNYGKTVGLLAVTEESGADKLTRKIQNWQMHNGPYTHDIAPAEDYSTHAAASIYHCKSVAYIPASKRKNRGAGVVYANQDGTLCLWNPVTKTYKTFPEKHVGVTALKYMPGTGTLVSMGCASTLTQSRICFWDIATRAKQAEIEYSFSPNPQDSTVDYIPARNERAAFLAVANVTDLATEKFGIKLWDFNTRKEHAFLTTQNEYSGTLHYMKRSDLLAAALRWRVAFFDVAKKQCVAEIPDSGRFITIAFVPNLELLAIGVGNKVVLFDPLARKMSVPCDLPGQKSMHTNFKYFKQAQLLVTNSYDDGVRCYEFDPALVKDREIALAKPANAKEQGELKSNKQKQKGSENQTAAAGTDKAVQSNK